MFSLPGPLRNFDGILAVGTHGGDVFLIDICRQDDGIFISDLLLNCYYMNCSYIIAGAVPLETSDEECPAVLLTITQKDVSKIEELKEAAVRGNQHLAIHLNGMG